MSLLAPIYSGVKSISDYITGSLAKQIADNLDTKVSSRLPADDSRIDYIVDRLNVDVNTRASGEVYTPARAALIDLLQPLTGTRVSKLDHLDANVSAIIEAITNYSPIKSIQTGFAALAQTGVGEDVRHADISISPVDINKAVPNVFVPMWGYTAGTSQSIVIPISPRLIDSNTLRISVPYAALSAFSVRWQVIEYK